MVHQGGMQLRVQIPRFSGKLCTGMGKVLTRFVEEMIYAIQARGSVRLSEVARSLVEETCLKKRIDRLSRNLAGQGWLIRSDRQCWVREGPASGKTRG